MKLEGRVWKFGSDVDTDAIIPARYLNQTDAGELAKHAMEDERPEFIHEVKEGDILVAEKNFGCGSSREQAASTLKGHELVIIARGFGRIFLQNAVNLGLQVFVCQEIEANEGDELAIGGDQVANKTTGKNFILQPLPAAKRAIIAAGGLIPYTRKRLLQNSAHES